MSKRPHEPEKPITLGRPFGAMDYYEFFMPGTKITSR